MFHCNHLFLTALFFFDYNNHLFAHLYGIKYSYLTQIISIVICSVKYSDCIPIIHTQLYGFK